MPWWSPHQPQSAFDSSAPAVCAPNRKATRDTPPLDGDHLEDVERKRHHHRPAQPPGVDEEAEAGIRPKHIESAPKVAGEAAAGSLGQGCLGFAGGDEGDAGGEEQARAQKHDGGVTIREHQRLQEAVGRRRHPERQQAAAEEPDRQHA